MNGIAVLSMTLLLIVGSVGWGELALRFILKEKEGGAYLYLPVGISVTLILGGILTALDSCSMLLLLIWHFVGLLLLLGQIVQRSTFKQALFNVKSWLFPTIIGVTTTLCALGTSASRSLQRMDDYPAYLYLAQKLVVTGGLIDPFNNRRILSYGGATLYQALYLKFTGTQGVFAFDNVLAPLAVVVTIYLFSRRFKINRLLVGLLCLVTVVGTGAGLAFNLSPRYSVTLLTLVIFMDLYDVRSTRSGEGSRRPWVVIGLLLSALVTLRLDNAVAPILATVIVIFLMKADRLKSLIVVAGASIISLSGWAIALYRSSGSLLYPFMNGTANKAYATDPLHWSIGKYISNLWQVVTFNNEFVITAFALIMGAFLFRSKGADRSLAEVLLIALLGWVVEVIAVCVLLKGYDPWMLARFLGPSIFAVGLFAVLALLAHDSTTNPLLSTGVNWWEQLRTEVRRPFDYLANRLFLIVGVVLSFAVCMGYQVSVQELASRQSSKPLLTTQFHATLNSFTSSFSSGVESFYSSQNKAGPLAQDVEVFNQINSAIPKDSKVLSAIEFPELLNLNRFIVSTLDIPGANLAISSVLKPKSIGAFFKVLRKSGYSYVVAEVTSSSESMYYGSSALILSRSSFYDYRELGNSILSWNNLIRSIRQSKLCSIERFKNYLVFNINRVRY